MLTVTVVGVGPFPLAVPTLREQGFNGGHIHFSEEEQAWTVPFQPIPLRSIGVLEDGKWDWLTGRELA